jgi:hypothetical protein
VTNIAAAITLPRLKDGVKRLVLSRIAPCPVVSGAECETHHSNAIHACHTSARCEAAAKPNRGNKSDFKGHATFPQQWLQMQQIDPRRNTYVSPLVDLTCGRPPNRPLYKALCCAFA